MKQSPFCDTCQAAPNPCMGENGRPDERQRLDRSETPLQAPSTPCVIKTSLWLSAKKTRNSADTARGVATTSRMPDEPCRRMPTLTVKPRQERDPQNAMKVYDTEETLHAQLYRDSCNAGNNAQDPSGIRPRIRSKIKAPLFLRPNA